MRLTRRKVARCITIQRWWRRVYIRDPIMLGRVRVPFTLSRGGTHICYDAMTLKESVLHSGDMRDPVCRVPMSVGELQRLDRVLPTRPLLHPMVSSLAQRRDRAVLHANLCDAFERELMTCVFGLSAYDDETAVQVLHEEASTTILQCFDNYRRVDPEHCRMTLVAMLHVLRFRISAQVHPVLYDTAQDVLTALLSELQ